MFTLAKSEFVWATVRGDEPDENGKRAPFFFDFKLRRMNIAGFGEWAKRVADSNSTNLDALAEVVVGFRNLNDVNGQPVEFSRDSLQGVLDWVGIQAFLDAMQTTLPKSKNS